VAHYSQSSFPTRRSSDLLPNSVSGRVRRRREGVGEELAFRKTTSSGEILPGVVHHDGGAAGIDLVAGEIGNIFHDGAVNETRARSEEHTSELQSRENLVC